jgi:hypothetical protein
MLLQVLGRGSRQQMLWRVAAALLLALLASISTTRTTFAAPLEPCNDPGIAVNYDPVGGALQLRMSSGGPIENYVASIERITFPDGRVIDGYCVDSRERRLSGVEVCLLAPIDDVRLVYLITKYPPTPNNNIEQAARQAAVWHFSNGLNLDLTKATTRNDPALNAAVAGRYTALLAEVNAIDPQNPPAIFAPGPLAITIDPLAAINQLPDEPNHPFTVSVTKGGLPLPGVEVRVQASFGSLTSQTGTTDATGEATFTISSDVVGFANITATATVTVPEVLEYVVKSDPVRLQPFGIPHGTPSALSASATKEWRNAPPPEPGDITLTKLVEGTTDDWSFSFELDGANLRTANNDAPTVLWEDLVPNRTYTLSEVDPGPKWSLGEFACTVNGTPAPDADPGTAGFQILVTPGANVACSMTNTKVPPGEIEVTKLVAGTTKDWSFTFTLDGDDERVATNASPTVRWTDLTPNRTYTLAEVSPGSEWAAGEFICSVDGEPVEDANGTATGFQIDVTPGDVVVCSITNTRIPPPPDTGVITLTKQVAGTTEDWSFSFTLNGANPRTATKAAPTVIWGNLEPDESYTLAEDPPGAEWTVGVFACTVNGTPVTDANGDEPGFQIVVTPGAAVVCSILNTKIPPPPPPGIITVTKQVAGTTDNWAFTFTLNGANPRIATKAAPTVRWTKLTPDRTYTLAETDPGSEWNAGAFRCTVNGTPTADADGTAPGFQIVVTPGANVVCSITNTRVPPPPPARITVTKVVTKTNEVDWSFVFRLNGANPRVATKAQPTVMWTDLEPNSTYVLSEDEPGAPWEQGEFVCTINGESVGDPAPGKSLSLTVGAGDKVVCLKYNVDISGTNLDPGEEPELTEQIFLPLLNR